MGYRILENFDVTVNRRVMLDGKYIYQCDIDGSLVLDQELHNAWHKSMNMIATELYGVDTEID